MTGNAIINSQGQGDNPVCSTRDEISQPSRPFSSRAATALEYKKTKTTMLYSKHTILEIPDLFQLSVAKFMYSFYNGGFPNRFDNYFAKIAPLHKYQTRLASLQKYYLPRMKTSLG